MEPFALRRETRGGGGRMGESGSRTSIWVTMGRVSGGVKG